MNEILIRLSEIEEKADEILRDAMEQKDAGNVRLERAMRELDEEYDRREAEAVGGLRERLAAEMEQRLTRMREQNERATQEFAERFAREKETLADGIVRRVTSQNGR